MIIKLMKPVGQPDWNAAINFAAEKKRLRIAGCIVVAAAAAIGIGIGFYGEELQNFVSEQQVKIAQMVKSADRKTEEEKKQLSRQMQRQKLRMR